MNDQYVNTTSNLISRSDPTNKQIALSYDCDDLEYVSASEILNILKKHNIKATFFITGLWAERFPNLAKRIAFEGHQIGNHSYQHPDMVKTSYNDIKESILKGEKTIKRITGVNPRPFFRPPYGSWNDVVLRAVGEAGYIYTIFWSINTKDWQQPSTKLIVERIFKNIKGGDIVIMHGHGKNTASASDFAIETLKSYGYKFVTISEFLK